MPIYEYRCEECGRQVEMRRPFGEHDAPGPACPAGHMATRKLLSVFVTTGTTVAPAPSRGGAQGCGAGCACAAGT